MHKYCSTVHVLVLIMPVLYCYTVPFNANFMSQKKKNKKKNEGTEEYMKPYGAACFCFADLC